MLELYISAFVTLFVIIDPLGCAPIFAGLTAGTSRVHARSMAVRATIVASAILLVFALFGEPLLRALGITLQAFRIAGGIMLFLIALEMVFEKRTQRREDRAQKVLETPAEDISVFPMGMPMLAGPGSIASVMLLMSQAHGLQQSLVVLGAMASILAITLVALLVSGGLMRVLGARVEAVITRVLGVLLAALAAQYVIDGVRLSFEAPIPH